MYKYTLLNIDIFLKIIYIYRYTSNYLLLSKSIDIFVCFRNPSWGSTRSVVYHVVRYHGDSLTLLIFVFQFRQAKIRIFVICVDMFQDISMFRCIRVIAWILYI